MPKQFSRYVLIIDNLSSMTNSRDIAKEMERCGYIRDVERDAKHRCALVEFERYAAPRPASCMRCCPAAWGVL
jgi:hypothetical protein